MSDSTLKLGLEVLDKLPAQKTRRKNPSSHVYKQNDGSYKFKAIVHEDAMGIQATRKSFKAMITVVPTSMPKKPTTPITTQVLLFVSWLLTVILAFYVDEKLIAATVVMLQLLVVLWVAGYGVSINKGRRYDSDTYFIY